MFTPITPNGKRLIILIAIGFLIRIVTNILLSGGLALPLLDDEESYGAIARHLLAGDGYLGPLGRPSSLRAPGIPILAAGLFTLTGAQIVFVRLIMCFIESLIIPACWFLARSMKMPQDAARLVALIATVFPTWIVPAGSLLSDIPSAILTAVMCGLLILGLRNGNKQQLAAAGACWGVTVLIRPVPLAYLPAILLWILICSPRKRRLVSALTVLAGLAIVLAPWAIRNTIVHGHVVLASTVGGIEFYKTNNPDATGILYDDHHHFLDSLENKFPASVYTNEAERSDLYQAAAVSFIRDHPRRFVELCWIRFGQLWKLYSPRVSLLPNLASLLSIGLLMPLFLIQAVRTGWRAGPDLLLLLIVLTHTAVHTIFPAVVRYRIGIEPLIVVMAVRGLVWIVKGRSLHEIFLPGSWTDRTSKRASGAFPAPATDPVFELRN